MQLNIKLWKLWKISANHELLILIALKFYIIVIFVQGSHFSALVILKCTREQRSSFGVWVCIDNQEYKETYSGYKKGKEGTSKKGNLIYIYTHLIFLTSDGS
jgi:uncharacterized protein (UPF0333 family)